MDNTRRTNSRAQSLDVPRSVVGESLFERGNASIAAPAMPTSDSSGANESIRAEIPSSLVQLGEENRAPQTQRSSLTYEAPSSFILPSQMTCSLRYSVVSIDEASAASSLRDATPCSLLSVAATDLRRGLNTQSPHPLADPLRNVNATSLPFAPSPHSSGSRVERSITSLQDEATFAAFLKGCLGATNSDVETSIATIRRVMVHPLYADHNANLSGGVPSIGEGRALPPAPYFPTNVKYYPIFSKPYPGTNPKTADHAHINAMARIILNADKGADIRVIVMHVGPLLSYAPDYHLNYSNHAAIQAMLWMKSVHGCKVYFLFNHVVKAGLVWDSSSANALKSLLTKGGITWKHFSGSPLTHENHCKFILINRSREQGLAFPPKLFNIVAQSSGNLYHDDTHTNNDILVTNGNSTIYEAYRAAFGTIFNSGSAYVTTYTGNAGTSVWFVPAPRKWSFFPSVCANNPPGVCCYDGMCNAQDSKCTEYENPYLRQLSLLAPSKGSIIRLAVAHMITCRSLTGEVLKKLYEHRDAGTDIRVIVSGTSVAAANVLAMNGVPAKVRRIHNKYLLTTGPTLVYWDPLSPYNTSKWKYEGRRFICTGSLNLDNWRQSDSWMRVDPFTDDNGDSWTQYWSHFDQLWNQS